MWSRQGRVRTGNHLVSHSLRFFKLTRISQIDHWIQLSQDKFAKGADFQTVSNAADELDRRLTLRSYVVGYQPTAADFAVWGAAKSASRFKNLVAVPR